MTAADTLARTDAVIADGQTLEARGDAAALTGALRHYDAAITLLHESPFDTNERLRHQLARAWMNRANALQRQAARADAVAAYDEAIALFGTLPLARHPGYRNNLAAAWMNRGHALQSAGDAVSLRDAARSFETAIALLSSLPPAADRSRGIILAASALNLAACCLLLGDNERALVHARAAAACAAPGQEDDPGFADIALKSHRAACDAIGHLIARAETERGSVDTLADEASDLVDAALALARRWEARGVPLFRPIAARLFRFGAQLYALHLPDFLAEFVLEHLDPVRSPGAMPFDDEFFLAAAESLARVRQDLADRRTVFLDSPETTRLLDRLRDLRAAEARLAELRPPHDAHP
ncbi:MAG TPA: hypothetical protein VHE13_11440 [Opitutus sp.]|nr:hypothetical protein [Opitutus sp.]